MQTYLTPSEQQQLLQIAREALQASVSGTALPGLRTTELPPRLQELGATFVTITRKGELRGCIGALEAYQPLAQDVQEHAVAAATQDYRFQPVQPDEIDDIQIEISYLSPPQPVAYDHPSDLMDLLRPNVDGVILLDGRRRATFLPQVWEKIPDRALFLSHLCEKMGAPHDLWIRKHLQVFIYQVEEFKEPDR